MITDSAQLVDRVSEIQQAVNVAAGGERMPFTAPLDLPTQPKIMIIDDEMLTIEVVKEHLRGDGYENFVSTDNAVHALSMISREQPDVVLLDIRMPQVSGLDILKEMRVDRRLANIPVIVLTATTDDEIKLQALQLGATDLLHKPIHSGELLARLRNTLMAKAHQDQWRDYSATLEAAVRERTAELEISRQEVIHCLARAAEFRDDDTGHHVIRVGRYARIIGDELGMEAQALDLLEQAAQLHDIGKIGTPDAILLKPGKLTPEEFDAMQRHCNYGKKIIQRMTDDEASQMRRHTELGAKILNAGRSPILELAVKIALTHHERWDGTGYPLGLAGEHIPIEGRITSVADVFDALSSKRAYKPAFPLEKSFTIMREGRGTQFDPTVLDAFFARQDDIIQVQINFADVE
jgi:putative two-component system response regulator